MGSVCKPKQILIDGKKCLCGFFHIIKMIWVEFIRTPHTKTWEATTTQTLPPGRRYLSPSEVQGSCRDFPVLPLSAPNRSTELKPVPGSSLTSPLFTSHTHSDTHTHAHRKRQCCLLNHVNQKSVDLIESFIQKEPAPPHPPSLTLQS